MVSVIIPVLNESATIQPIIELVRQNPLVDEVLVIDDGSIDSTPEIAQAAGARVLTSTLLGKGGSICMLQRAGASIAFQPANPAAAATHVIENNLQEILNIVGVFSDTIHLDSFTRCIRPAIAS